MSGVVLKLYKHSWPNGKRKDATISFMDFSGLIMFHLLYFSTLSFLVYFFTTKRKMTFSLFKMNNVLPSLFSACQS